MANLATVFFVFMIQVLVLVTVTGADPQLDVHPTEIVLGTTSSLDINCSFSSVDHPEMAAFTSLILSRTNMSSGQAVEDLAAITQFSPDSVTVVTQEKFTATGVHSQTGQSFLQITWDYPTATQAGVYRCVAHGLDILGQTIEVVNSTEITVAQADINNVFEKLKQMELTMGSKMSEMEITMARMEKHIQALEYNNSQMSTNIEILEYNSTQMSSHIASLEHTMAGMAEHVQVLEYNNSQMNSDIQILEDNNSKMSSDIQILEDKNSQMNSDIQILEDNNSQMSSHITNLEHTVATLQRFQPMNLIGTYENHDYYVSKEVFTDIHLSIDVCKSYGGQLVEVDDRQEFLAIQGFLSHTPSQLYYMIAGTDEESEGTWVLQSTNKPVPYISWADGQPNGGTEQNCLHFYFYDGTWSMADYACHWEWDQPNYVFRYMCEIESV